MKQNAGKEIRIDNRTNEICKVEKEYNLKLSKNFCSDVVIF